MRSCKFFDKYRDKELDSTERMQFERHLAACPDCRMKRSLIDNIAFVLKQDKMVAQPDLAGRIAMRAFGQKRTWDSLIVSWLRPGPALVTVTVMILIFSFLVVTMDRQTEPVNYYETLMNEADSLNLMSSSNGRTNNELVIWLEQEKYSQ